MTFANLSGWIGLLLAIVTAASIAAVIVAYFRVSLARGTIDLLTEHRDALSKRNDELDTAILRMEKRMAVLESDNKVLREAVSGRESNAHVIEALNHHHDEVTSARRAFSQQYRESQVVLGQKLEANHKALNDILTLLGHHRANEANT